MHAFMIMFRKLLNAKNFSINLRASDGSVSLLTGGVPNLCFDSFTVNLYASVKVKTKQFSNISVKMSYFNRWMTYSTALYSISISFNERKDQAKSYTVYRSCEVFHFGQYFLNVKICQHWFTIIVQYNCKKHTNESK